MILEYRVFIAMSNHFNGLSPLRKKISMKFLSYQK